MAAEDLAAEKHAFDVHAHDAVELFLGDVEKRRGGIDPRAVHHDVDAARTLQHCGKKLLEVGLARRFRGMEPRTAAALFDPGETSRRFFLIAANNHDLRARTREALSHRSAQLTCAADDHCDLARERKQPVQKFSGGHLSLAVARNFSYANNELAY